MLYTPVHDGLPQSPFYTRDSHDGQCFLSFSSDHALARWSFNRFRASVMSVRRRSGGALITPYSKRGLSGCRQPAHVIRVKRRQAGGHEYRVLKSRLVHEAAWPVTCAYASSPIFARYGANCHIGLAANLQKELFPDPDY